MKKINPLKLENILDRLASEDIGKGLLGNVSMCVTQNGETLYKKFHGIQNFETGSAVTEDSVFRLASMTKPITGFAAAIELDRGHIGLFDPVDMYLPNYSEMNIGELDENGNVKITKKAKGKVRIVHLLTHSSGLGSENFGLKLMEDFNSDPRRQTLKGAVDAYPEFPLAFEPYSKSAYSAVWALNVMARIVEITSGMEYDEFLKKEIFDPLGMTDTTFDPTPEQWERMVYIHNYSDGKVIENKNAPGCVVLDYQPSTKLATGGLAGTLGDYVKFAEMLLNKGKYAGGRLVSETSARAYSTPLFPEYLLWEEVWGMGVRVVTVDHEVLPRGAFGWSGMYGTHFWVDPVNNFTAVFMTNTNYGGNRLLTHKEFERAIYSCLE